MRSTPTRQGHARTAISGLNRGVVRTSLWALGSLLSIAQANPGDWPEPRQNACLTAIQSLPGAIGAPPQRLARFDLGRSQPLITAVARPDRGEPLGLCIVSGALRCYDTKGAMLWESHPPGLNYTNIVTTEDINGDGQVEILLKAGRPADPYGAAVLVALESGRVLWRYDVEPMSYAWYLYLAQYLPGVTSKQIVVIMQGYPPEKDNGYIALFDWPSGGSSPRQKWRYNFSNYTCFPSFLQSDLDGDGVDELVVECHSHMWFLDAITGSVKHYVQWDVSPANVRSYGLVRFLDLNGDGREDFLCIADFAQHHEVLINRQGKMEKAWHHGWPESVTTGKIVTTWPEPPQADVDGDGKLEIVVSMFNSEHDNAWMVRVYDAATGKWKYRCPGAIAARCVDVDGDGVAEILVNRSNDPSQTKLEGAELLGVTQGNLKVLWEDRQARALDMPPPRIKRRKRLVAEDRLPVDQPARIAKDKEVFALTGNRQGGFRLNPCPTPAPKPTYDFKAVPAVVGLETPVLLAADLTGDHRNELVLHGGSAVQMLGLAGNDLQRIATYKSDAAPVFADLDGDGKTEIVLIAVSPTDTPVVEAITPTNGNRTLWRSAFPKADRLGLPAPRRAYVRPIRLTGKTSPDLYVWAGTPLVRSVGLDGRSGRILWEKGELQNERYYGPSVNYASAYDFNKDGKEDLVFTNPDFYCVADGPTGNMLLGPLLPRDIFRQPSQGLYTCPVILDRKDTLPTVCLVAGHYFQAAMSLRAEPYWYTLPATGDNRTGMEGFLRLKDGNWLMGFGRQNGKFACVNVANGTLRWELDLQASASDIVTCDIDGDGCCEFLFGTSHGGLYAVGDKDGAPRLLWKANLGAAVGSPILTDLDGDGRSEIAVVTSDGYVNVLGASHASTTRATPVGR